MAEDIQVDEVPPAIQVQELEGDREEVGHLAQWSVTSHKYGFGVENLRDDNENTFWQSEGPQPHAIDLNFPKRVFISAIALRTSHPRDDSYTPSKISIRAGNGVHDLQEVRFKEFSKPDGWIVLPLRPFGNDETEEGPPIPCHHLRILILANHLNGKDTHVRGLRIFGAAGTLVGGTIASPGLTEGSRIKGRTSGKRLLALGHDGLSGFTSKEFKMHEFIR